MSSRRTHAGLPACLGHLPRLAATILAFAILVAAVVPARAADDNDKVSKDGVPEDSLAKSFPKEADPGGYRKALAERGITYGLGYIGEWESNVSGGLKRGSIYVGQLKATVDADLEKLAGLTGLTFHADGFQIHGRGLTDEFVGSLMTVSSIEALATTRLWELWLEQKLVANTVSVRFGQLAADTEFFFSVYGYNLLADTWGWPVIDDEDLPSGGPAYPFATPGVRIKVDPSKDTSMLLAIFNGDPAGPGPGDPQTRNRHGTNFRIQDPPLVIGELQLRANQDKDAKGLASWLKLGGWYHFGSFDDQRLSASGQSLADPNLEGGPLRRRGNYGLYALVDQQIWRPKGGDAEKGIGVFARISASPSDRNLLDLYIDGGVVFAGLVPGRPDDILALGGAYTRISDSTRDLDRDVRALTGEGLVRTFEAVLEANYKWQIMSGWELDLDVQHYFNPGGHVALSEELPGRAIPDATVLTLHTELKY